MRVDGSSGSGARRCGGVNENRRKKANPLKLGFKGLLDWEYRKVLVVWIELEFVRIRWVKMEMVRCIWGL